GKKAISMGLKMLTSAKPMADTVEHTTLDPVLFSRMQQNPLSSKELIEFLASLNAYVQSAGSWLKFLGGNKGQGAEEVCRHFGMALNAHNAEELKEFLTKMQQRIDLAALLTAATGEKFDDG